MHNKPRCRATQVTMALLLTATMPVWAQTNDQIVRRLAENNEALRQYSWTTRVEVTDKDEKFVGLYKMRYDIDGNLQPTPMSSDAPAPEDIAPGIRQLARFAMSYAQPGRYAFQRFLNSAEMWEGRGSGAGTLRIDGNDLNAAGDSVLITAKDDRAHQMKAETSLEGQPFTLIADYRQLPQDGPTYVARMTVSVPSQLLDIQIDNFDYFTDVAVPVRKLVLAQGTEIQIRSTQPLSTESNKTGETFEAIVDQDVVVDGKKVAAKGTRAVGRLAEVERSGRRSGVAKMSMVLTALYLETGPLPIQTELLVIEAAPTTKRDAGRVVGTTAMGTIIGAIAGGGKGALIGAAIGAGTGGVVTLATRGTEVELPAEQLFVFRLAVPVEIPTR